MGWLLDLVKENFMRKYLLVILTFCYLGCEDSEDISTNEVDDVYISSDFIRCWHTYLVDVSLPSNDTIGIAYNIQWNNLVKKQPEKHIMSLERTHTYISSRFQFLSFSLKKKRRYERERERERETVEERLHLT